MLLTSEILGSTAQSGYDGYTVAKPARRLELEGDPGWGVMSPLKRPFVGDLARADGRYSVDSWFHHEIGP